MADELVTGTEGTQAEGVAAPAATPTSPAPSAPAAAAPAAAPSAPTDHAAQLASAQKELETWKSLGFTPEQARQAVAAVQRAEQEAAREEQRQREAFDRTPDGQKSAQRRQAFLSLLEESLGPDRTQALLRSLENFQRVEADQEASRVSDSRAIMRETVKEAGLTFKDKEDAKHFENVVSAYIQNDSRLNQMYFNPETRAQAVKEACDFETNRLNRFLQSQGATDLKTAAARRASVPRTMRGSGTLATVTENVLGTSTNRAQRRSEQRAVANSALDAVFAELGM